MRRSAAAGTVVRPLEPETMDGLLPYREARRALLDLDRVNRWLLGTAAARRALAPRLARAARDGAGARPVRLLDLGSGSGTVVRQATAGAGAVQIVAVDRRLTHLVVGRALEARNGRPGRLLRVAASVDALPFRDGAFDWSFSHLLFHHFDAPANRRVLAEALRCARRGAVVVDLRRSRLASTLARLAFPLLGLGPVARRDGLLSLRQSWHLDELRAFTRDLPVLELRRRFPFRWSLVLRGR